MVKGTTRQVILVKAPDEKLFEQAIFLVKEEALAGEGVGAAEVMEEARQAAWGYLNRAGGWRERVHRVSGPLWGVLGAVLASVGWMGYLYLL